ncbi:MAG: Uma2 family endonuclease [Anaerolineae bacterium]
MESTVERIGMPLDEYIRQYDEQPFELIDGERKPLMVNVAGHGEIAQAIFLALHILVSANHLGYAFLEQTFVLSYDSKWVTGSRKPDVMYYSAERMDAYKHATPNYKNMPYILVPDLAVEVISPTDDLHALNEKVNQYLLDGVKVVWVFDPQPQTASIHTLTASKPFTKQQIILKAEDTLTGGDLIPKFEIKVANVFA